MQNVAIHVAFLALYCNKKNDKMSKTEIYSIAKSASWIFQIG